MATSLLLALAAWVGLFAWGFFPASPPGLARRPLRIASSGRWAAVDTLASAGLLEAPLLMKAYVTLVAPLAPVVAREHWLGGGRTPRQLVLALGDRGAEVLRVALPEGRTSFDLAERLESAGVCRGEAFLALLADARVLSEYGVTAASAEGYLFPESHELFLDDRAERVLRKFLREGQARRARLAQEYPLLDEHRALGFGWHEVVTLASIVEKETAQPDERSRIARVFLNRLRSPRGETGGRLESDPTAVYGCRALGARAPASCAQSSGTVSPALLRDAANPYATYRRAGLPPGPIGNPGEAALVAVLRPAPGDELYFVADGLGKHHFSRTFAEHRQAVERLKALRRPPPP